MQHGLAVKQHQPPALWGDVHVPLWLLLVLRLRLLVISSGKRDDSCSRLLGGRGPLLLLPVDVAAEGATPRLRVPRRLIEVQHRRHGPLAVGPGAEPRVEPQRPDALVRRVPVRRVVRLAVPRVARQLWVGDGDVSFIYSSACFRLFLFFFVAM